MTRLAATLAAAAHGRSIYPAARVADLFPLPRPGSWIALVEVPDYSPAAAPFRYAVVLDRGAVAEEHDAGEFDVAARELGRRQGWAGRAVLGGAVVHGRPSGRPPWGGPGLEPLVARRSGDQHAVAAGRADRRDVPAADGDVDGVPGHAGELGEFGLGVVGRDLHGGQGSGTAGGRPHC